MEADRDLSLGTSGLRSPDAKCSQPRAASWAPARAQHSSPDFASACSPWKSLPAPVLTTSGLHLPVQISVRSNFKKCLKGGRERERNISVWLPLTCPTPGTWPATQACALTRKQTSDPLVLRPALNPLSHTSQG